MCERERETTNLVFQLGELDGLVQAVGEGQLRERLRGRKINERWQTEANKCTPVPTPTATHTHTYLVADALLAIIIVDKHAILH